MRDKAKGVVCQGQMKISWSEEGGPLSGSRLDLSSRNERLLRALLMSQETHHEVSEESGDLARVEAKLDLLLDLVSQMLQKDRPKTVMADVLLWMEGLNWTAPGMLLPSVNQLIWMDLYIDDCLAQPLKLPVRVVEADEQDGEIRVEAVFVEQDEQVMDLINKYIFRQHRRSIAQKKAEHRAR